MPSANFFDIRNMNPQSLIDKIALSIWQRIVTMKQSSQAVDETAGEETTFMPISSPFDPFRELRAELGRYDVGVRSWKAYLADARAGAGIDSLGDHATAADNEGRVFKMTLDLTEENQAPQIKDVFTRLEDRLVNKLRLEDCSPQILKRAFIEGDAYREVVLNVLSNTVVDFKEVPGAREGFIMKKLLDKETDLHVGWGLFNAQFGSLVRVYAPWQIVQFSWNRFGHYGTPLLQSTLRDIDHAAEDEESMHVARQERAYVKYAHIYEGVPKEELKKLRKEAEAERKKRGSRGVQTDFYVNKDMKMFDPSNASLSNITDVQHIERKIMTAVRYPKGFFGGQGDNINRAVLEKQEENLLRFLSKADSMLSSGFRELGETQLLLWGVLPEDLPFSFLWTDKNVSDFAGLVNALATAVEKIGLDPQSALEELGFESEVVQRRLIAWRQFEESLPAPSVDAIDQRINQEANMPMDQQMNEGDDGSSYDRLHFLEFGGRKAVVAKMSDGSQEIFVPKVSRTGGKRGWRF